MPPQELAEAVKRLAAGIGYCACGIAPAGPFPEYEKALEERMKRFPETSALYGEMRRRANPAESAPWAKSAVVCVRAYGRYKIPKGLLGRIGRNYLFDSRAKASPEHGWPALMKEGMIKLGLRARKGGLPDRLAASMAGVAAIGKNCFAYSPGFGSWINIETWLVDALLPPDEPAPLAQCPPGCRACMDACPTKALVEPYLMRMDRCVAWLSYASPEPVPEELGRRMGGWIYGCDACQEACPLNKGKWEEREKAPWLEKIALMLNPEGILAMDEHTFKAEIRPLFWYIPENNLARWKRNAQRTIKNTLKAD